MNIEELFDPALLDEMVSSGFVNKSRHPTKPLAIYNYSASAQYSRMWNEVTLSCRGLIVADDGVIVARPFQKFFNFTEVATPKYVITTPPVVHSKLDGSLGIIFHDGEDYAVATRGSFESDQAKWATEWLRENQPNFVQPEHATTLCEIIYPANRIVVEYAESGLFLIAAIDKTTGADIPLWEVDWWEHGRAEHFVGFKKIDDAYMFATGNDMEDQEGVVCAWYRPGEPSFRLKVKHPEYVRLHRILTNTSSKTIWQHLSAGESTDALIELVPDEFYDWVHKQIGLLTSQFSEIEYLCTQMYNDTQLELGDGFSRKDFAWHIRDFEHKDVLFKMLDGKPFSDNIWKKLKPEYSKPFMNVEEEF